MILILILSHIIILFCFIYFPRIINVPNYDTTLNPYIIAKIHLRRDLIAFINRNNEYILDRPKLIFFDNRIDYCSSNSSMYIYILLANFSIIYLCSLILYSVKINGSEFE